MNLIEKLAAIIRQKIDRLLSPWFDNMLSEHTAFVAGLGARVEKVEDEIRELASRLHKEP